MDIHLITEHGPERRPVGELADLLGAAAGFVWVDIPHCDAEAVKVLTEVFGFHPLAGQDCVERNRVPKMHAYPDHVFVVLHAPERGERGHVHYLELDQCVGAGFLVTVHGPTNPAVPAAAALRETRTVLDRLTNGRLRPESAFALSHAVVAALIRNQEEYVERATADVWRLEQQVTGGSVDDPEGFLNELFRARHGLLAVRTMSALSSAIYGRMAGLPALTQDATTLVADTADRFTRVRRIADGEREYLQGVIEFYQSVLTVKVAAVYGMNFDHMPELHWHVGYPFALGLMAASAAALHRVFTRRGWL